MQSNLLENRFYRLEIDKKTGAIKSLWDKKNEVEIFSSLANLPIVIDDPGDAWGHGINSFRRVIGFFKKAEIEIGESGPIRAILLIKSYFQHSEIEEELILYEDFPFIECRMKIYWREKFKMLKLSFPLNLVNTISTYEIPYGYIVRKKTGEEEPGQRWVDLTGKAINKFGKTLTYGFSLINNSKYGFDVKDSELRMSILRSPIYAHYESINPEKRKFHPYLDQGLQEVRYYLLPHSDSWQSSEVIRKAFELNSPLIYRISHHHQGFLPPRKSFLRIEPTTIILSTLKKAEGSDDCYCKVKI